jgi:Tfp pilus assembly protein PilF
VDAPFVLYLAERLRIAGHSPTAVGLLERLLQEGTGELDLPVRQSLVSAQLAAGHTDAAARELAVLTQREPEEPVYRLLLAAMAYRDRRFDRANQQLDRILGGSALTASIEVQAHLLLALLAIDELQWNQADAQLRQAVARAPADPTVLISLAYLAAVGGDLQSQELVWNQVSAELRWALSPVPADSAVPITLACIAAVRGVIWNDAEQRVRQALRIQPDYAEGQFMLGWVLVGRGQQEKGLALMEQAMATEDLARGPANWEHLGDVYRQLGRTEQARAAWKKAFKAFPPTTAPDDRRKLAIERKLKSA